MSFIVLDAVRAAKEALLARLDELKTIANTINAKPAGIKSVQRGVSMMTVGVNGSIMELVVTIAEVNPAKTSLNLLSGSSYSSTNGSYSETSLRLVSSTQIGITNGGSGGGYVGQAFRASWEVIEWHS